MAETVDAVETMRTKLAGRKMKKGPTTLSAQRIDTVEAKDDNLMTDITDRENDIYSKSAKAAAAPRVVSKSSSTQTDPEKQATQQPPKQATPEPCQTCPTLQEQIETLKHENQQLQDQMKSLQK